MKRSVALLKKKPRSVLLALILLLVSLSTAGLASHLIGDNLLPGVNPVSAQTGPNALGIVCGYGASAPGQAFPAPIGTPDGDTANVDSSCQWAGDVDGDGALDPLVSDSPSLGTAGSGGGFTADVVITGLNTIINGFDLTIDYNTTIIDAIKIDQTGLLYGGNSGCPNTNPSCTLTTALSIDRNIGEVRVSQAVLGITSGPGGNCDSTANPSCVSPNQELFRIRFDIVGTGSGFINFSTDPVKNVITNPGAVQHTTLDSALITNDLFNLVNSQTAGNFNESWTFSPNPEVPGASITFSAAAAKCSYCTAPFTYSWDFSSQDSAAYVAKVDASGQTATVTAPPPVVNRVTLTVADSAAHSIVATRRLPLTNVASGPTTAAQGTPVGPFSGKWLGGVVTPTAGYSGLWRLCPGTALAHPVCSSGPVVISQAPGSITQTTSVAPVSWAFAGLYNDFLSISDAAVSQISANANTVVAPFTVNVTGATPAYTVAVTPDKTSINAGSSVTFTAVVTYAAAFPAASRSTSFSYLFIFGDGSQDTVTTGTDTHTFNTGGTFTVKVVARETGAASPSQIQENGYSAAVTVIGPLTVAFTFSPSSPAAGELITFTSAVSGGTPPYSYAWNFGDGTTSTLQNPTHSFATVGTDTVGLTVTDSSTPTPQTKTISKMVTVAPAAFDFSLSTPAPASLAVVQGSTSPSSSITATLVTGTAVPVTFSTSALPSGVTATFSNSPCSPTCTTMVSFAATATATLGPVTVTINVAGGSASHSVTLSLTVTAPVAVPTVTVNNPTPNPANTGATVTVTFSVTSTAAVTGITVNWGDGTALDSLAGTATSDTHIYANTGTAKSQVFTITVTATNSAGPGSGTTTETINDRPPIVTISTVSPNPANTGATVTVSFTATDPDGTVSSISVDWGDASTPTSLGGTATSATHTYANTGSAKTQAFTISVTATDNSGSTGFATTSETVNDRPPVVSVTNVSPNPVNTGVLVTLTFTATDPDGTVSSITVNWGDSSPVDTLAGTATSDTHTYSSAGSFTITVTATDNSGSTGLGTGSITVNQVGVPTVTVNSPTPNPANTGQTVTVTFTVSSSVTVTSITVNWGDGTTPDSLAGTATSDTHIYASTGTSKSQVFTITVTATNSAGPGSGTNTETVNDRIPTVTISNVSPNPANTGQTVTVTFSATDPDGTVSSISVNWGDGTAVDTLAGTAISDTHSYASTGSAKTQAFTITVTATDNSGSTGSATMSENVNDRPPVVSITNISPNPVNTGVLVTATFTATDPDGTISSIMVNWGDGTAVDTLAGTATSDTHTYASPGSFTITVTATDNSGSTGQATGSITVNVVVGVPTVTVNSPTPNPANTGQLVTVTFTVSSTAPVTGITVNWGDGTTNTLVGSAAFDTHTYSSTGNLKSQTFTITVTAINSAGPGSGTTTEVVNDLPPVVTISSVAPTSPCVGQSVTVSFVSTDPDGTVASNVVSWGDGTAIDNLPGTATSDTHTYTVGGTFAFSVTATDNSGSTGQGTGSITTVLAGCVPTVTVDAPTPNPANTGQLVTVTFTVTSSSTVDGITVNWGDGTTNTLLGTVTMDSHAYASTGSVKSSTFTITVTATNSAGPGSGTTTEVVNDLPPAVIISNVSPNPANTGQLVTVTFSATDPDGTVSSITVSWGDGSAVDTIGGGATSDTHTYSTASTFTITVTATDNSGSTGQATGSVTTVVPVGAPTVTVNNPTPNPADTGTTVTVAFTVSTTAPVTGVSVDWGDGTTNSLSGSATSDTHSYSSTGSAKSQTFTITVTATNSAGPGSGSTTETVNDRPPVASFTFTPLNPFGGQAVNFDATPSTDPDGTITGYAWDFGDGTSGTGATPTHVYNPASTMSFAVMLTVTDNSGNTGSTSQSVTVTVTAVSPPTISITNVSPNPASTGQMVTLTFTVSSTATVTGITVNWGDGTTLDSLPGTATSDSHSYANTGNAMSQTFTITVTATNSGGPGTATTTETVNDRSPLVTISTVSPNPANTGQLVTAAFTAADPDGTVSSISVNWGDSSVPDILPGTATSDTHTYAATGSFTITVTATDNSGSTGSATTSETVAPVTTTPIQLTFQAFNFTAFHDGFGSFEVLVNGQVVEVVNIPFVRSATITNPDSAPGANSFVNFGPFDITAFVVQGQNNVTFVNPTSSRFSLIKNVMITQGNTVFLNVKGARFVSPGRPVTFTFSNPPLTITSFTISNDNPFAEQDVTFTATYAGGTGPFKCLFRFGNGDLWGVKGNNGSCSVSPDYDAAGTFTATVRITGSTTGDDQRMTLPTSIDVQPDPSFTTTSEDIASQSLTANNLQSFSFTITNPSGSTIVFRVDVLVTLADGSQTWLIGQSLTLQPGQTTSLALQAYPVLGQHGTYNFKAALKFGIDNNNDGILQTSEKIATTGYLFGSFSVP